MRVTDTKGENVQRCFSRHSGMYLPINVTLPRAVALLRERWPGFPDCQTWSDLQKACAANRVVLLPTRVEVEE